VTCESTVNAIITVAIIVLLVAPSSHASVVSDVDIIKESAVFIYLADPNGAVDTSHPLGTGFLVSIPLKESQPGYLILLTARHILKPSWAGCSNEDPARVYLRLNTKTYDPTSSQKGIDFVPVDLEGNNVGPGVVVSSDDQVDAAIVLLNLNHFSAEQYEIAYVPVADFATDGELGKLGTGDAVVSAGLFSGSLGERRNYPMFKFGAISIVTGEPFFTGCSPGSAHTAEKVWFLSINLPRGSSGSAVFYVPPRTEVGVERDALNRAILIGVQSSSFDGADIAAMTPIEPVFRIIESMNLPHADLYRGSAKPAPFPTR
jgi:hypothetical protein